MNTKKHMVDKFNGTKEGDNMPGGGVSARAGFVDVRIGTEYKRGDCVSVPWWGE